MSVVLKYDYLKYPANPSIAFPRRRSVLRPVIPIKLKNGTEQLTCHALVDSGADWCVFHTDIGEAIGIAVQSGKLQNFGGVATKDLEAYFHHIKFEVGGYEFDFYAGFSDAIRKDYGILGQVGFFSLFDVRLDYKRERIELKR